MNTLKRKDKTPQAILDAQAFVDIHNIQDNILQSSNYLFGYLSIRDMPDSLLTSEEQEIRYVRLAKELEQEKHPWAICSIPWVLDTQAHIEYLLRLKSTTKSIPRLELLNGEIESLQEMARAGAREPRIYLKIWEPQGKKAKAALTKRLDVLAKSLGNCGIQVSQLTNPDIALLCKTFSDLGYPSNDETHYQFPVLKGKHPYNVPVDLINEVTPIGGVKFEMNRLFWGSMVGRVYIASGYAKEFEHSWATDLMNNIQAVTCITFDPSSSNELAQALSNSIRRESVNASVTSDTREKLNSQQHARDGEQLLMDIDQNKEIMGMMSILTMPFSSVESSLDDVCKDTVTLFRKQNIQLKCLGQQQKEGFKTLAPYYTPQPIIKKAYSQLVPIFTLAGGSAMSINTFQDPTGCYLAKTPSGNIVNPDLWFRGGDRTNSNMIILGPPGIGKSTLMKHIIQILLMIGTEQIIIDPEREYSEITKHLGGTVINTAGGKFKVNLFEVRQSADDESDEKEKLYSNEAGNKLAMHLRNMQTWFQAYLGEQTSDLAYAKLDIACRELYKKFGIDWDTDFRKYKSHDYPIMADLVQYLEEHKEEHTLIAELADRLNSAAYGADKFIFNGYTNVNLNAPIICFDTKDLQNSPKNIKQAQYLNLMNLSWDRMCEDPRKKTALIGDEAYLMIERKLPEVLLSLRNMEKRARKVEGMIALATHSAVDLMHEEIRQYGQALLTLPTYKFFMPCKGKDLLELEALYNLTQAQQNILLNGERGHALSMLGNTMMHLDFDLPQYKLDNMGQAGGR